jgi:phosphomannomutase
VQVTASHNGPKYNGFKVSGPQASPIGYLEGLNKVEAFVSNPLYGQKQKGQLKAQAKDVLEKYLDFMDPFLEAPRKKLKIAVDCANGMGGFFMPAFAARYPKLEILPLFWELDGNFPNHEADPIRPENLADLQNLVLKEKCDFGIAFDGDADRCALVDEGGAIVSCDLITALIAPELLRRYPGSAILYDLRSSKIVPQWIEAHGGKALRGKVGHSFMKKLLKEQNASLGGELSGHYYFKDCFNTDSALMAMIQLINIGQKSTQNLSELIKPLQKYFASGETNFKVSNCGATMKLLEAHYRTQGTKVDYLDGLTIEFKDWWFNLRASNTEPLLRLNLEANNPKLLLEKLSELTNLITKTN